MRLFIGIPLEEKLLNEINNLCSKLKKFKKIKFVNKENFHITLKFLGETDDEKIPLIKNAMEDAFKEEESFFITTNKISAFPAERKAKVIWFNVDKNIEKVKILFDRLEKKLIDLYFEPEKKEYVPHITVARAKEAIDISEEIKNFNFEFKSKISNVILYQSILKPEGAFYKKIYEKNLI